MKRILTTVVGSWPRSPDLVKLLMGFQKGEYVEPSCFEEAFRNAIKWAIGEQVEACGPESCKAGVVGIDIVSDGEQGRFGYVDMLRKYTGFGKLLPQQFKLDSHKELMLVMDPEDVKRLAKKFQFSRIIRELEYTGEGLTLREIREAKNMLPKGKKLVYTVPSPATVIFFHPYDKNMYRDDIEAMAGVSKALRREYETVLSVENTILQIDDPASAMGYHLKWGGKLLERLPEHARILNEAIRGLPKERIRVHVCYGNYAAPHMDDIPFNKIMPYLSDLKVGGLVVEMANPRHQADIEFFREHPTDKTIAVGVVDVKTPIVEHPKVVKKRLLEAAKYIPLGKLQASPDCGFGTFAFFPSLHPKIARWKLDSLVEGAYLASKELELDFY